MATSNKSNITKRSDKTSPLTHDELDLNFDELGNVIDDASANENALQTHENASDPHPQYALVDELSVDYEAGIEITQYNQIVRDGGEFWRVSGSEALPYTLTGAGVPEGGALVSVGDAALRQDLVQPVATFNSVASMKASAMLDVGRKARTLGYNEPGDGGGNDYEIVAAATGTDDGGSYIDLSNGFQAKGLFTDGDVNLEQFGIDGDGFEVAEKLRAALELGKGVSINTETTIEPDVNQAENIFQRLDEIKFLKKVVLKLPDSNGADINLTNKVELTNETFMNLIVEGEDTPSASITDISQVGGSKSNYSVQYTVSNSASFDVGDYALITSTDGTGDVETARGCFKVIGRGSSSITVNHTFGGDSWPTLSVTSGTVWPLKTVLRWPSNSLGLVIAGASLRTLSKVVIAGSFDIAAQPPGDGPADGLQVGSASDTPNTGANESERQPSGSLWASRIGIVEWDANGVQVISGHAYMVAASACANGWRGFQSAGGGSLSVKSASAVGNGASGYEAEGNGFTNANNSTSSGNLAQGYYTIGVCNLSCSNSVASGNETHGYDARNQGYINADNSVSKRNGINGVTSKAGYILFGSGSDAFNNGDEDCKVTEGGTLNGNGASSLGTLFADYDSGATVINEDGDKLPVQRWESFPSQPVFEGVSVSTNNSIGLYCQVGNIIFWQMTMDYSGLDTSDNSPLVIGEMPTTMNGRIGGCNLNLRTSSGISFASTDTFHADYNLLNDRVVIIDNGGNLLTYNSGKIESSGTIDISGWYRA